ncbi:ESPR domain-containing protein [Acinetobacter johnsonii]|nr:ESPR domain-containing protein [Acinetobacter johnsonii]
MNKLYKVVWNARLQCWQAVSEFAKSHSGASSVKTAYDKKEKNAVAYAAGVAALTLSLSVSLAIHDNALPAGRRLYPGVLILLRQGIL